MAVGVNLQILRCVGLGEVPSGALLRGVELCSGFFQRADRDPDLSKGLMPNHATFFSELFSFPCKGLKRVCVFCM